MNIALATDHAGFELKEHIKKFLTDAGHTITDYGAFEFNSNDDYPDFIKQAARTVSEHPEETRAIIFGGSGQGEAIVANRFRNVRAMVYNTDNPELITLARKHNDANVLSIGARFVHEEDAKNAVTLFLETEFSNDERHVRRIEKIEHVNE